MKKKILVVGNDNFFSWFRVNFMEPGEDNKARLYEVAELSCAPKLDESLMFPYDAITLISNFPEEAVALFERSEFSYVIIESAWLKDLTPIDYLLENFSKTEIIVYGGSMAKVISEQNQNGKYDRIITVVSEFRLLKIIRNIIKVLEAI